MYTLAGEASQALADAPSQVNIAGDDPGGKKATSDVDAITNRLDAQSQILQAILKALERLPRKMREKLGPFESVFLEDEEDLLVGTTQDSDQQVKLTYNNLCGELTT